MNFSAPGPQVNRMVYFLQSAMSGRANIYWTNTDRYKPTDGYESSAGQMDTSQVVDTSQLMDDNKSSNRLIDTRCK